MHKLIAIALLVLPPAVTVAAEVGQPAPAFELTDQYGETHALSDYAGQWLVVFFYPRADTPGCTTEACSFRDNIYAFRGAGAEVVGISVDRVADQKAFSDKYKLPFTLLSDHAGEVSDRYGVLREMDSTHIAKRETFLIAPDGTVARHYEDVDPETHTRDVIADLEAMQANTAGSAGGVL